MLAMFLCRDILGMTYMSIAEAFNRDHSTVIHAVEWATSKADMQVHIVELREDYP